MIAILVLLWLASGAASHVYWVRNQYNYTTSYIPTSIFAALVGPVAWFVGWSVYGEQVQRDPKILFKKRQR